jgi:D-alanine-D-alanine ligase
MLKDTKLRVGVIFGGRSGEHEVSLMSARSVLAALDPEKYQVTQIGIAPDGSWWTGENVHQVMSETQLAARAIDVPAGLIPAAFLPDPSFPGLHTLSSSSEIVRDLPPNSQVMTLLTHLDVVIPVLHGTFGEDGTLQGVLEMAGTAYVGAGVLGSALGMDKGIFKDVMRANHIPIVETVVVLRSEIEQQMEKVIQQAENLANYPLFVKPANLGSSVGITKCQSRADLIEGLIEAASYDRRVVIERGVNAREIEVSVLGNDQPQASIPGEIIPSREFYSYEAKYIDDRSTLLIPAPLSPHLTHKVQDLAVRAYRAIDCAGMARVDFLLDKDTSGEENEEAIYVSEINTIPGFTSISMYPKLWEASGLAYPALVDRLIELALERQVERDRTERCYKRED